MKSETNLSEQAVSSISQAVMRGVAGLFINAGIAPSDYAKATEIIRAEIKAFLFGDEYLDERICVLRRSLNEQVVIASVCLSAFNKIRAL